MTVTAIKFCFCSTRSVWYPVWFWLWLDAERSSYFFFCFSHYLTQRCHKNLLIVMAQKRVPRSSFKFVWVCLFCGRVIVMFMPFHPLPGGDYHSRSLLWWYWAKNTISWSDFLQMLYLCTDNSPFFLEISTTDFVVFSHKLHCVLARALALQVALTLLPTCK